MEIVMKRHILTSLIVVCLLAGCSSHKKMMEPLQKPEPAPEMAKLEPFIGTWQGTAEIVEPSPEEMKALMPEGEEMPECYKGGGTFVWVLDGMTLKGESWHEMGEGLKASYVEYWTWDPKKEKYRIVYVGDWGDCGTGLAWYDEEGKTMHAKFKGVKHDGSEVRGEAESTLLDDDTIEWSYTERGKEGKMKFKGMSHRKR
jgi:hypothetical protein